MPLFTCPPPDDSRLDGTRSLSIGPDTWPKENTKSALLTRAHHAHRSIVSVHRNNEHVTRPILARSYVTLTVRRHVASYFAMRKTEQFCHTVSRNSSAVEIIELTETILPVAKNPRFSRHYALTGRSLIPKAGYIGSRIAWAACLIRCADAVIAVEAVSPLPTQPAT
jgi:hypothetical protein